MCFQVVLDLFTFFLYLPFDFDHRTAVQTMLAMIDVPATLELYEFRVNPLKIWMEETYRFKKKSVSNKLNSSLLQQHLCEVNDPLVEQAILDNIEDVYYKDDSFDTSLYELQVSLWQTLFWSLQTIWTILYCQPVQQGSAE